MSTHKASVRWNRSRVIENIALSIVCIWIGYSVTASKVRKIAPAPDVYKAGDVVTVGDVDFSKAESTVLLFLRSTCIYCTKSMPFYSTLARDIRRQHRPTRIIVVTNEDAATAYRYLNEHSVEVDDVVAKGQPPAKISGTPTIVVAKRDGVVQKTWRGQLQPADEREVRAAIGLRSST